MTANLIIFLGPLCRAQPVFWCAGGVTVDTVLRAAFGAQRLGMLASLPRYPGHAALAAGGGISAADEPLRRTLSTPIMGTVWIEEVEIPDGLAARFFSYTTDSKTIAMVEPKIASSACSA